ncbi:MAG: hypothetical protein O2793_10635 [Proteobacteria bacterium]|nr:hypothetical protein [Pseudomonadota bacterium]MDA1256094.1 hypothetical protein [Pseudomonadota bacterium]
MAIHGVSSDLNKKIKELDERDYQWIWFYFGFNQTHSHIPQNSFLKRKEIIHNYISQQVNKQDLINKILIEKENSLINKEFFNWIDPKDIRHCLWCFIKATIYYNLFYIQHYSLDSYREFIYSIDISETNLDQKILFINNLRVNWSNCRTPDKETSWIKQDNIIQLNWAWDYLKKNNRTPLLLVNPSTNQEIHSYILCSFDLINNPLEKELLIIKMKKTWSQKKFRDSGKLKKPYHIPLSKHSHKNLENLSKIFNKPISQVLEFIIEKTYNDYTNGTESIDSKNNNSAI